MLQRRATRAPKRFWGPIRPVMSGITPQSAAQTPGRAAPATSIVHDLPDGGSATAALRAAAETTVNFSVGPRPGLNIQCRANINNAQYITGTDNHGARYTDEGSSIGTLSIPIGRVPGKGKTLKLYVFQFAAGPPQAAATWVNASTMPSTTSSTSP